MKHGVILLAHGSPDSADQMEAYLNHIMKRRKPTPEFIREMQERYRLIGGRSPLLDITRAQAMAIEEKLDGIPVFLAMRHWHPFIHEVLPGIVQAGITHLVAMGMTPYAGRLTADVYLDELTAAAHHLVPALQVVPVKSWHDQPRFIEAWHQIISKELNALPAGDRESVHLLFTAHSVPEETVQQGDPYPLQIQEAIKNILKHFPEVPHDFAWQSRSPGPGKWLEPDVDTKLKELHARGVSHVLIVPVGFVCDHVEVLYDLDILHAATAKKLGLTYHRTESLNTHPFLIEAMVKAIRRALSTV